MHNSNRQSTGENSLFLLLANPPTVIKVTLYIDESYSNFEANNNGYYVLSGVWVEAEDEARVRVELASLKLSRESKAHWSASSRNRKHKMVRSLTELPLRYIAIARRSLELEHTEFQRRKALERMLDETSSARPEELVLESRGAGNDRKDNEFVSGLRLESRLSADTEIRHVRGQEEPLLWSADFVCGALLAHLHGQTEFWEALAQGSITELIKM